MQETVSIQFYGKKNFSGDSSVDVLVVEDFKSPFSRPETPGFHSRTLLTKYEGHDENQDFQRLKGRMSSRHCRRPEEP